MTCMGVWTWNVSTPDDDPLATNPGLFSSLGFLPVPAGIALGRYRVSPDPNREAEDEEK